MTQGQRYVQQRVLAALKRPMTVGQLVTLTKLTATQVEAALATLLDAGRIQKAAGGSYAPVKVDILADIKNAPKRVSGSHKATIIQSSDAELHFDQVVALLDVPRTSSDIAEALGANQRRVADMLSRYAKSGELEIVGKEGRQYIYALRESADIKTDQDVLLALRHAQSILKDVEQKISDVAKERDEAKAKLHNALRTLQ